MNKTRISCAIIDDEPLSVRLISNYINLTPELELVFQTTEAPKAIEFFKDNQADLLFLDIQMPEINGLDVGKALGRKTKIIITTAYQEYALSGYDLDVIDFLLKPITYERFAMAAQKAITRFEKSNQRDHIFIKVEHKNIKILYDDIVFIEGLRDYVAVHTRNEKYLTLESIKNLELLLNDHFLRIHKSYLINTHYIKHVERNAIVLNAHRLPIGDAYRSKFLDQLGL
jgi:two-component system, LytTR family, response regulator